IINASREPLLIAVVCVIILIQVNLFNGTIGALLVSLLFFYRALTSVAIIQSTYNRFLGFTGSLNNVKDIEQELSANSEKNGSIKFPGLNDHIELRNTSFGYSNSKSIVSELN